MITRLRHIRVDLALHRLRDDDGPALLLLHGLGEASTRTVPTEIAAWPGAVHALDFTGHGASAMPRGGGYTAEALMGDADTALQHLGTATVVGRGLGAYIALLLAGARPEEVRGAILRDGPGLAGGGVRPGSPHVAWVPPDAGAPPDPFALAELSRDIRPPDYAATFARLALQLSPLERPITICARERPDWLAAVANEPGVEDSSLHAALAYYSEAR